jgi:hypothetical protein
MGIFDEERLALRRVFPSGAIITNHSEEALDGGFPRPRPLGRSGTRAGFSLWRSTFAVPESRTRFGLRPGPQGYTE